jgi:hypothetical protein
MADADRLPPVPPASDRGLRIAAAGLAVLLAVAAFALRGAINPRVQAVFGIIAFIALIASFSRDLRAVNWRTVGWGMALQVGLALFILKFEMAGVRPGYAFFAWVGDVVKQFLEFTNAGSQFVFGVLADPGRDGRRRSARAEGSSSRSRRCRPSSSCRPSSPCCTTSACCSSSCGCSRAG